MVTAATHLLRRTATAIGSSAPPTPPTPPPDGPCPDGFSECSLGGCCSSDFGGWSSMALSFVGIVMVLVCCWCWRYVLHARSLRSAALLATRPRTRRLSEISSTLPSSAPSPSARVSWHGEPPPVLADEPPPLYQPPAASTAAATLSLPLPLPATDAASPGRCLGQPSTLRPQ